MNFKIYIWVGLEHCFLKSKATNYISLTIIKKRHQSISRRDPKGRSHTNKTLILTCSVTRTNSAIILSMSYTSYQANLHLISDLILTQTEGISNFQLLL